MHRYAFDNCPVCALSFKEDDDIVVCPVCGTPHHRECYMTSGVCANESRHDEGFSFTSFSSGNDTNDAETASKPSSPHAESDTSTDSPPFAGADFSSPLGQISDSEAIDGVPVGDLKKFIGPAWMYYIPLAYAKLKGFRIFRINFSAFLGSYAWLFARKFYLLGTVSAVLNLVSYLYLYLYINFTQNLGIDFVSSVASVLTSNDTRVVFGYYLYLFAGNLPFILSLLTALFANNMYMNKAVKTVKQINRKSETAEEFNSKLEKKGGINMPLLFIALALTVCYFILDARGIINDLMAQLVNLIM